MPGPAPGPMSSLCSQLPRAAGVCTHFTCVSRARVRALAPVDAPSPPAHAPDFTKVSTRAGPRDRRSAVAGLMVVCAWAGG
ncbi:hypothetical protein FRC09_014531, partial [Ceratobasidium sp. 395]